MSVSTIETQPLPTYTNTVPPTTPSSTTLSPTTTPTIPLLTPAVAPLALADELAVELEDPDGNAAVFWEAADVCAFVAPTVAAPVAYGPLTKMEPTWLGLRGREMVASTETAVAEATERVCVPATHC